MPFFEDEKPKKRKRENKASTITKNLVDALFSQGLVVRTDNLPTWDFAVRAVQNEYGPEADAVINWYIKNITNPELPMITSPEAFRNRFALIHRKLIETRSDFSEESHEVYNRIKSFKFASFTKSEVMGCLDATFKRYTVYRGKLEALCELLEAKVNNGKRQYIHKRNLLKRLLSDSFRSPVVFCETWMRRVSNELNCWKGFKGNLSHFVFSPDANFFRKWALTLTRDYTGDSNHWTEIEKMLAGDV